MANYNDFNKFNCAPYSADHIGVYNSNGEKVLNINLGNLKPNYGTRLYRFGLLSDVHNRKNSITQDDADFQNALNIFNNKESVNFTCICGDITQDATESEFQNYKSNVYNYSPNTPVYTTTGNHDAQSSLDNDMWFEYTNCERCMSFEYNNDLFVFFGMSKWSLGSGGTPYLTEDIDWLESILNQNQNKRVFIFTHLFFPTKAGNFNNIYPTGNWLGGSQLERIQRLNELYLNSIWFSGHSHWMWYLQSLPDTVNNTENADRANIYRSFDNNNNPTCGWTVHVPSCASPIDSDGSTRDDGNESRGCSEGAIVDVYDNYIVIRGVSFKDKSDSNYTLKYLPIAQYKLDTSIIQLDINESTKPEPVEPFLTDYLTANDCTINTSKNSGCTVEQDGDYIVFNFDKKSQGFYIKPNRYVSSDILSCSLAVYDVIYEEPYNWTDDMISKVGFYTGSGYTVYTGDIVRNEVNGVQFNVSSSYPGDLPIRIKVKAKFYFY